MPTPKLLAIYTKFSTYGGVSRMMVNLANSATEFGINVHLISAAGEVAKEDLSPEVKVINFKADHVYSTLPALVTYLRKNRPNALLAVRHRAITSAILARALAGLKHRTKLAIRLSGNISSSVNSKSPLAKSLHYWPINNLYSKADLIIAVSRGVADDLISSTRITGQNIEVLPNPSIPEHIYEWSKASTDHSWLNQKSSPVILGMGRFTKRKDFVTLVRAFSILLKKLQARLILVGDGEQKKHLQQLVAELNIESHVDFPGFTKNPYAYMSRADLLVLSSTGAEGSPNVLKEALALGLPVVSTDCPSGPREILDDGRLGCLVPVQDPQAMSRAMLKTLREPTNPEHLRKAARKYSARSAAKSYLQELGLLS